MNKILMTALILFQCLAGHGQTAKTNTADKLLNSNELESKIDDLVKDYLELDIFSGVVLVAEQGEPVYHKAFGLANRDTKTPNTVTTKFDIGSMNKTFTKIVVLQLLEEGQLKRTDRLGKYIEGFPKEAAQKITVEHLLNHSSGYGDYFSRDYFDLPASQKNIASLVERIKKMPLLFEPGTEMEYSNSGYILLGAIIEAVTGKTYHQNVKDRIVMPLGLTETYVENKDQVPNRAIGYLKTITGELEDNTGFLEVPNPDGGFQSTTTDILKFYREYHYGNQLLKEATKMKDEFFQMIQEHTTSGGAIPHAGGFNGANTVNYEILRDKITIIVFANMDEPVAEQLGAGILAIIRGQEPKAPAIPAIQNVYQSYSKSGIEYVRKNFDQLITNFHPTDPKDFILNMIGYELMHMNQIDQAIEIFHLNTELFPEVANVWDSLGEAYLKKGNKEKALTYYKKALEIDPELPSARNAVEKMKH